MKKFESSSRETILLLLSRNAPPFFVALRETGWRLQAIGQGLRRLAR